MEVIQAINLFPRRLLSIVCSPTRDTLLILLTINILITIFLVVFHVRVSGLWYYMNELIFVIRGFGTNDSRKCYSVFRAAHAESDLWRSSWPVQWYWRMQCLGNWDARHSGRVARFLNRTWIWTIFDVFWVSIAGPCFKFASYMFKSSSQCYNAISVDAFISVIKTPFEFVGDVLLGGAQWSIELIASLPTYLNHVVQDPVTSTSKLVAKILHWPIRVITSYVSYFDFAPFIKNAFGILGKWLSSAASPIAAVTGSLLSNGVASVILLLRSFVAYFDDVPLAKNVFESTENWLNSTASNLASAQYWQGVLNEFRIPVRIIANGFSVLGGLSLVVVDLLRAPFVYISKLDIWSAFAPETGIPYLSLLALFTLWINVHMHRTYTINKQTGQHWTEHLWHTPFALLDILCFGSDGDTSIRSDNPVPQIERPNRHSSHDLIKPHLGWRWVEVPGLLLHKIISPIFFDGFLRGIHSWYPGSLKAFNFDLTAIRTLGESVCGKVSIVVWCIVWIFDIVYSDDIVKRVVPLVAGAIAIVALILFSLPLTIATFVFLEICHLVKSAWKTVFSRSPFSKWAPSRRGFVTKAFNASISQGLVLLLIYIFNHIASAMSIPLTLTYTSCLLYGMASEILKDNQNRVIGENRHVREYRQVVFNYIYRIHAVLVFFSGGGGEMPFSWSYASGSITTNPIFYLHSGIVTDFVYHGLSVFDTGNLVRDVNIGFYLLITYLRRPGREWFSKRSLWQSKMDQISDTAAVSPLKAIILLSVVLGHIYLSRTVPRISILFALILGSCFCIDPRGRPFLFHGNDSKLTESVSSPLNSVYSTFRSMVGIPCFLLLTLMVTVQCIDEPYIAAQEFKPLVLMALCVLVIAVTVWLLIELVPSNPNLRKAYLIVQSWLPSAGTEAGSAKDSVTTDTQGDGVNPIVHRGASLFLGNHPLFWTALECSAQVVALLFTLYALTYLSFNLAFYSIAVPGILLFLYILASVWSEKAAREAPIYHHPPARPHGLQAIHPNLPVPAWAKDLWWIIPSWTIIQSITIVLNSEAIILHFHNFTLGSFIKAWTSSSYLSIAFFVSSLVVVKIMEKQYMLELLWNIGSSLMPYIPFDTRPARDQIFFQPNHLKDDKNEFKNRVFQSRVLTELIFFWVLIALQLYNPGCWSLGIAILLWTGDILKVEAVGESGASPTQKAAADVLSIREQMLADAAALRKTDAAIAEAKEEQEDEARRQAAKEKDDEEKKLIAELQQEFATNSSAQSTSGPSM
ncbi:hypothetical protein VTL71DRAFT_10171 [Oculimacula yallundae]|uniref:Uncharacterized protein n=1 Tax=Oculimacula yallundae TaxID=86028 RepID=A0ABR4BPS7_9HELO